MEQYMQCAQIILRNGSIISEDFYRTADHYRTASSESSEDSRATDIAIQMDADDFDADTFLAKYGHL